MFLTFRILAVCVFGFITGSARGEDNPPKLELKLSLSKSEIVQLEPIALTISVQNLSKEPQKIHRIFDPDWQYLKIFLTTTDGKAIWLRSGLIKDGRPNTYTLPPKGRNDVIRYRLLLSGQPKDWMDTPGEYKLHITFDYAKDSEPLTSKPVKLTVKPAEGIDKEALDRFRGYPQAEFLARGSTAQAIAEQFRFVVQKYPKSVYTPWCYYILGWAAQNDPFVSQSSRATNARDYYGRLLKDYPKFPMKTEVEYEMARELLRLGEDEGAIDQLEVLASKHSDLSLFKNFDLKKVTADNLTPHYPQ